MLYIMRHGKTDWNVQYRLQGRTDIPLNDMGRSMAKTARETYRDVHFDICYVSPLIRAKETAEIFLQDRNIPIVVDERLAEMSFGEYEGMANIFQHPELPIYKLFKDPLNYVAAANAETFGDILARTRSFLDEIAIPLVEQGKDVLIVGHGAMNSALITNIRGVGIDRFWEIGIENCKLIQLIPWEENS